MESELAALSQAIGAACHPRRLFLAVAESCTGGWVAQVITHTAGSSTWFERGFVTYSDAAKIELLGVHEETLARFGAVSIETAQEMAVGALKRSRAQIALAITGIAGPGGGSPDKPVGTVCFAWCREEASAQTEILQFTGEREDIRRQSVVHALEGLLARLDTL